MLDIVHNALFLHVAKWAYNLEMKISKNQLKALIFEVLMQEAKKVDYKKAYKKYHSSTKAKKERAQRNAARRKIEKAGIDIPDGYEVDHKNAISNGGSNDMSNLRLIPREENRALGQKVTTRKRKKNGSY